jgi:hypothetical protein
MVRMSIGERYRRQRARTTLLVWEERAASNRKLARRPECASRSRAPIIGRESAAGKERPAASVSSIQPRCVIRAEYGYRGAVTASPSKEGP